MKFNYSIIQKNYDKLLHIVISYAIFLTLALLFKNVIIAFIIAFTLGIIKEVIDGLQGYFDFKDILSNFIGLLFAYIVILIIGV